MKNDALQIDPSIFDTSKKETTSKKEGSILDVIDLGFNSDNVVIIKPTPKPQESVITIKEVELCKPPDLVTCLSHDNYLSEFKTEEERAIARHNLGLYNGDDIVALSLLTTNESNATDNLTSITVKLILQGNVQFAPLTIAKAVFVELDDGSFKALQDVINGYQELLDSQTKLFHTILDVSDTDESIATLPDVTTFLSGYKVGDTLNLIITNIQEDSLKFEIKGEI